MIVEYDRWKVKEFEATPEKVVYLWNMLNQYRSLFSDLTMGDKKLFDILLVSRDTFWMEVLDEKDELAGVMYLTDTQLVIDAQVHIVFFDRQLAEKAPLCKLVIEWLFRNFPFRRLTASIPSMYFATIRLAKKIGFKEEGRRRDAYLIGNRWVDEEILGILRAEVI